MSRSIFAALRLLATVAVTFLGLLLVTFLIGRVMPVDQEGDEKDTEKRRALYEKIQRSHQVNSPFGVMFQQIIQTAIRKNVEKFVTGGAVANTYYWVATK